MLEFQKKIFIYNGVTYKYNKIVSIGKIYGDHQEDIWGFDKIIKCHVYSNFIITLTNNVKITIGYNDVRFYPKKPFLSIRAKDRKQYQKELYKYKQFVANAKLLRAGFYVYTKKLHNKFIKILKEGAYNE